MLEIVLVASLIWEEHEENFLLVFNLIFSSSFRLCSSDMDLSSWLLGLYSCDLSSWLLGLCSCDGFEFLVLVWSVKNTKNKLKNMKNIKKTKF